MRILILGGAHAHTIADAILQLADAGQPVSVAGFLDDDPALHDARYQGIAVLGPIEAAPSIPHDGVIVGIGANQARRRIYESMRAAGLHFVTVRHPQHRAIARCRRGTGLLHRRHRCHQHRHPDRRQCPPQRHRLFGSPQQDRRPRPYWPSVSTAGNVRIGIEAQIGIGATILPQRTIGARAIVGAGAVVTRDVPDDVIVVGSPARPLRR